MQRKLGRSGQVVSGLGLGCWAIGGPFWSGSSPVGWGDVDDAESIRAIHRALDLGVTFFDTSDVYGAGHSERVLGEALAGHRESVVVATKFGNTFDEDSSQMFGSDTSPDYIRRACDASLARLRTDYIDLYQLHTGLAADDVPAMLATLEDLVAAGKIRSYAWSTDIPAEARAFAAGAHCTAVQYSMNLLEDVPEMVAVCEELDLAGVIRSPLAMGLLTGKFTANSQLPADDIRGAGASWMRYFVDGKPNQQFLDQLAAIREILTSGGRTLGQGALAWLWARSTTTITIPGFKNVRQAEENASAMSFGPLTDGQMQEIAAIQGNRQ